MQRVVISGMGLICGNAREGEEFINACLVGKSGIKKCTAFDTTGMSTAYFGEIDGLESENRFEQILDYCAKKVVRDAGVSKDELGAMGSRCRSFLGTLIFMSDPFINHAVAKKSGGQNAGFIAKTNDFTARLRDLTGVRGQSSVITTACASGTTAVGMAFRAIRSGLCEAAIAGGVDALSYMNACGFNALKALSHGICSPFTQERDGINIGEAGALFFVETLERAKARGAKIYAEIVGSATGNDAYHITSLSPDGSSVVSLVRSALADAGIDEAAIDYINAHGTGTVTNDPAEMRAISSIFGNCGRNVYVSSSKALLGHCMGAAGAIEIAATALSLQRGKYLPMPQLKGKTFLQRPENIKLAAETFDLPMKYALSTSIAFSGNNAALILKKYEGGAEA